MTKALRILKYIVITIMFIIVLFIFLLSELTKKKN
jgi:hypothetical protein